MKRPALTPNQIVAYNLRRAREQLLGITLEEAAELLEPYIGMRWSKQTFSQAENYTSDRTRQFTADDLLAFARAFAVSITYFLMPPAVDDFTAPPIVSVPDGELSMPTFAELLAGTPQLADRLARIFGNDAINGYPEAHFTASQEMMGALASAYTQAAIRAYTRDLSVWRKNLHDLDGLLAAAESGQDQALLELIDRKKQSKKGPKR